MIDWRHWHNEPHLIGGLVLLAWLYALATGPLRSRLAPGVAYPRREAWKFYLALVLFYLAVGSPLDQAGERYLLSAHMVQHQILIYPCAALFLLGLPSWLAAFLVESPRLGRLPAFLVHPLICGIVYTLVLSLWHVPALYDWALQDRFIHILEHVTFFGAALFFWWPVLSPSSRLPRLAPLVQMLYLTAVVIAMTPLFAFLAFSNDVLYPTYEYAPRLVAGFGPAEDQLLGAAIMKAGSISVTLLVFFVVFFSAARTDRIPAKRRGAP